MYATTDLAALRHRVSEEKADRILYVTDAGQAQHFAMVFDAARAYGLVSDSVRLDHVPFGLVLVSAGRLLVLIFLASSALQILIMRVQAST